MPAPLLPPALRPLRPWNGSKRRARLSRPRGRVAMEPETIQRPNGSPYRPRRVFAQAVGEEDEGVLVLGTHDLDRAQSLADKVARYIAGSGFVSAEHKNRSEEH